MLLGIFIISFTGATNCKDIFYNTENNYTICGYCYEEDGSACLISRQCNFSIYYENKTNLIYEINTTNQGDGSFTYNLSNSTALGNYFGFMFCDNRSYSDFSFQILSPSSPEYTGSTSFPNFVNCYSILDNSCFQQQFSYVCPSSSYPTEEICLFQLSQLSSEPKIINDVKVTLNKIYSVLSPTKNKYAKIILIGFVLLIFLLIFGLFKKIKIKKVKKEKENGS